MIVASLTLAATEHIANREMSGVYKSPVTKNAANGQTKQCDLFQAT
jgi:hypothetical protein